MSQLYILHTNYHTGIDFQVYYYAYSKDTASYGVWATDMEYATKLNIFEAKQVVHEYKLKDYNLIEIKE